jgi:hypothetical protein
MLNQFWSKTLANTITAVNSNTLLSQHAGKLKECIVKLMDNTCYQVHNELWAEVYQIHGIHFDTDNLYYTFHVSDVSTNPVRIALGDIVEKWKYVKVNQKYFMYDCLHI